MHRKHLSAYSGSYGGDHYLPFLAKHPRGIPVGLGRADHNRRDRIYTRGGRPDRHETSAEASESVRRLSSS